MKKLDDDTINDMILQWHDSNSELPLHEYLGMSKKQYAKWIEKDIPKIKVITLFTYWENDIVFLGLFKSEDSLIDYIINQHNEDEQKDLIFKITNRRKSSDDELDWNMDVTFETNSYGRITSYAYKFEEVK